MKIRELIEELQKWPPDDEVYIPEMNMSGLVEAKSVTNHPHIQNAVEISENE